jgi:uncharacterized protein
MQTRPTILTHSGISFNLLQPDYDLIEVEDIAHALSNICRFTGHTRVFYSVAQHSYLASFCVPPEFALEALMHDATEAYVGDVSSPLKSQLHEYRNIEFWIDSAIRQRFNLPASQSPCVKHADLVMLATEKRDLMPAHTEEWALPANIEPLGPDPIQPMAPDMARWYFLDRFKQLTNSAIQPAIQPTKEHST